MNKKFSTLLAASLVAGSMAVNAAGPERPYEFRTADVRAAVSTKTVNQIQSDKWYQLTTSTFYKDNFMQKGRPNHEKIEVLVQYRDMMTGKLYLRLVPAKDAPLNPSLWKLDYIADGTGGGKWKFINKETNVELTFDPAFAVKMGEEVTNLGDPSWMIRNCVDRWEWYNTDAQASDFTEVAPYAYFKTDSVVTISRGYDGYLYSRKGSKSEMINNTDATYALKLKPVEARAITLDADDFNSMIDYHKPSVGNKWAKFLFFDGKHGLDDAVEIAPNTGGVMDKGMAYQAEEDGSAVRSFYEASVAQFDGTTDPAVYGDALRAVNDAKDALRDAGRVLYGWRHHLGAEAKYNEANANFSVLVGEVAKLSEELEDKRAAFEAAYDKAENIAEVAESIYTDAMGALNPTLKAARAAYIAETDVVEKAKKAKAFGDAFTFSYPSLTTALNAYGANEISAVESYGKTKSDLEQAQADLTQATKDLDAAKSAYETALATYEGCENILSQAIAQLQTYNVADDNTNYLIDEKNHFMKLQYMGNADGTYLMVDTAFWQGNGVSPENANLKLAHKSYNSTATAPIRARFFYNITYYPTQDSLVIEPLNASGKSYADYQSKKTWAQSWVANNFAYRSDVLDNASQASNSWTNKIAKIALKLEDLSASGLCLTAAPVDATADIPLKCRIAFDNQFKHLTRTTLDEGLYFIKAVGGSNAGRYLVDNFRGKLMYDVEEKDAQDYNQMPATMWVVEKLGSECGDLVIIRNREYGETWNPIFEGQLYKDGNSYFTVDNHYGEDYNEVTEERMLTGNKLLLSDDYEFIPVQNEEALTSQYHGYGFKDPETLKYTNYALRYNHNNSDKYLNVQSDGLLKVTTGDDSYYELETEYAFDKSNLDLNAFGYGAGVVDVNSGKKLPQLVRQRYVLKVKDINLIDNDTTYVAMNTAEASNGYYIAKGIKEIRQKGLATLASFYLKNDQYNGVDTCYALIDTRCNNAYDYYNNGYRRATVVDANGYVEYNSLNNYPNSPVSAFALTVSDRPLYRSIPETGVNFFRTVGNVDQKLFHDATNQSGASAVIDGFGYLGLAQEKMEAGDDAKEMFVEPLRGYSVRMPQYMLAIEKDTVADGLWCNTNTHGYFADEQEAIKEDETHLVFYNGYTEGRFLVNLQDSVTVGSHAYHNPDKFTFNGYAVRLGFVEGVHMVITPENAAKINAFLGANTVKAGEFFYVPINGKTLADLKNDKGYLIPGKLFDPANAKRNEYATGKHNNWSFSFRLIDDETPERFYIESYLEGHSYIGSWTGSWVKIYNNCPVVNFIDGEHGSIEGIGLKADNVTDGQEFKLTSTSEGPGVANEDVSVSSVKVIAKDGGVSIIGAAGKKVSIANILGQSIASQILSSDDVTISAPAGVVVVSVEGEEAVKAIVK